MMKVRIIETGAVVELEDDYALRMIEQGKAVLYSGDSAGAAAFETGAILAPVNADKYTDAKRCHEYHTSEEALAGLTEMGFTTSDQVWKSVVKYFSVDPVPNRLIVSIYPKTETGAVAMATLREIRDDFYGCQYSGVTDDDNLKGIVDYIETNHLKKVLFCPIPNPVSYAIGNDGLCKYFFDQQSDRFMPIYASQPSDATALMGLAMGLRNIHPAEWFTMRFAKLGEVPPQNISASDLYSLQALNCNAYIVIAAFVTGSGITWNKRVLDRGVLSSGKEYADVLSADLASVGIGALKKDQDAVDRQTELMDIIQQFNMRLKRLETAASGT